MSAGPVTRLIEAVGLYVSATEGWHVLAAARPFNAQLAAEASINRTNHYTAMIDALAACDGIEECEERMNGTTTTWRVRTGRLDALDPVEGGW